MCSIRKLILFFLIIHFSNLTFCKTHVITLINYSFSPSDITVNIGDTIQWINTSNLQHTATSGSDCTPNGIWDSKLINPEGKFSFVFTKQGKYPYFCIPHCSMGMKGLIMVKENPKTGLKDSRNKKAKKYSSIPVEVNFVALVDKDSASTPTTLLGISSPTKYIVKMTDYKFDPSSLTINAGDTVVWMNTTEMVHTSTSGTNCNSDGKWNSKNVDPGQEYTYVFTNNGTFPYFCIPHCLMGMTGVVQVGTTDSAIQHEGIDKEKKTSAYFKATDLINNQSVATLPKGYLEFKIYHRFDDLAGSVGSFHNFYGLDNIREYRLGFAYGINNRLMVGIARNKGDQFQTPYQQVSELYDGYLKYRILKQKNEPNGKAPFSLSLFANTVVSAMKSQTNNVFSEAYFPKFSDRFSHCFQLLVAYNLLNRLSLQIMPTYLKRNWVNPWTTDRDEINLFSLGGGARWNLTKHFSLIGEYFYTFSDYRREHKDVFSNPLAVGLEISTGKHVFHLNLSNSTGVIPNTFIPYTTSSWGKGQFRFGFSITRLFLINKKNSST